METPEDMPEVERNLHLLRKGDSSQRLAVIQNLPRIVREPEANSQVFPLLIKRVFLFDKNLQQECAMSFQNETVLQAMTVENKRSLLKQAIEIFNSTDAQLYNKLYCEWINLCKKIIVNFPCDYISKSLLDLIKELTRTRSSLRFRKNGYLLLEAIISAKEQEIWDYTKEYKQIAYSMITDKNWRIRKQFCAFVQQVFKPLKEYETQKPTDDFFDKVPKLQRNNSILSANTTNVSKQAKGVLYMFKDGLATSIFQILTDSEPQVVMEGLNVMQEFYFVFKKSNFLDYFKPHFERMLRLVLLKTAGYSFKQIFAKLLGPLLYRMKEFDMLENEYEIKIFTFFKQCILSTDEDNQCFNESDNDSEIDQAFKQMLLNLENSQDNSLAALAIYNLPCFFKYLRSSEETNISATDLSINFNSSQVGKQKRVIVNYSQEILRLALTMSKPKKPLFCKKILASCLPDLLFLKQDYLCLNKILKIFEDLIASEETDSTFIEIMSKNIGLISQNLLINVDLDAYLLYLGLQKEKESFCIKTEENQVETQVSLDSQQKEQQKKVNQAYKQENFDVKENQQNQVIITNAPDLQKKTKNAVRIPKILHKIVPLNAIPLKYSYEIASSKLLELFSKLFKIILTRPGGCRRGLEAFLLSLGPQIKLFNPSQIDYFFTEKLIAKIPTSADSLKRCIFFFLAHMIQQQYGNHQRDSLIKCIVDTQANGQTINQRCQFLMFCEFSAQVNDQNIFQKHFFQEYLSLMQKETQPRVLKFLLYQIPMMWRIIRENYSQDLVEQFYQTVQSLKRNVNWPEDLIPEVLSTLTKVRHIYEQDEQDSYKNDVAFVARKNKILKSQAEADQKQEEKAKREVFENQIIHSINQEKIFQALTRQTGIKEPSTCQQKFKQYESMSNINPKQLAATKQKLQKGKKLRRTMSDSNTYFIQKQQKIITNDNQKKIDESSQFVLPSNLLKKNSQRSNKDKAVQGPQQNSSQALNRRRQYKDTIMKTQGISSLMLNNMDSVYSVSSQNDSQQKMGPQNGQKQTPQNLVEELKVSISSLAISEKKTLYSQSFNQTQDHPPLEQKKSIETITDIDSSDDSNDYDDLPKTNNVYCLNLNDSAGKRMESVKEVSETSKTPAGSPYSPQSRMKSNQMEFKQQNYGEQSKASENFHKKADKCSVIKIDFEYESSDEDLLMPWNKDAVERTPSDTQANSGTNKNKQKLQNELIAMRKKYGSQRMLLEVNSKRFQSEKTVPLQEKIKKQDGDVQQSKEELYRRSSEKMPKISQNNIQQNPLARMKRQDTFCLKKTITLAQVVQNINQSNKNQASEDVSPENDSNNLNQQSKKYKGEPELEQEPLTIGHQQIKFQEKSDYKKNKLLQNQQIGFEMNCQTLTNNRNSPLKMHQNMHSSARLSDNTGFDVEQEPQINLFSTRGDEPDENKVKIQYHSIKAKIEKSFSAPKISNVGSQTNQLSEKLYQSSNKGNKIDQKFSRGENVNRQIILIPQFIIKYPSSKKKQKNIAKIQNSMPPGRTLKKFQFQQFKSLSEINLEKHFPEKNKKQMKVYNIESKHRYITVLEDFDTEERKSKEHKDKGCTKLSQQQHMNKSTIKITEKEPQIKDSLLREKNTSPYIATQRMLSIVEFFKPLVNNAALYSVKTPKIIPKKEYISFVLSDIYQDQIRNINLNRKTQQIRQVPNDTLRSEPNNQSRIDTDRSEQKRQQQISTEKSFSSCKSPETQVPFQNTQLDSINYPQARQKSEGNIQQLGKLRVIDQQHFQISTSKEFDWSKEMSYPVIDTQKCKNMLSITTKQSQMDGFATARQVNCKFNSLSSPKIFNNKQINYLAQSLHKAQQTIKAPLKASDSNFAQVSRNNKVFGDSLEQQKFQSSERMSAIQKQSQLKIKTQAPFLQKRHRIEFKNANQRLTSKLTCVTIQSDIQKNDN